jgi:hypothetical protein
MIDEPSAGAGQRQRSSHQHAELQKNAIKYAQNALDIKKICHNILCNTGGLSSAWTAY